MATFRAAAAAGVATSTTLAAFSFTLRDVTLLWRAKSSLQPVTLNSRIPRTLDIGSAAAPKTTGQLWP